MSSALSLAIAPRPARAGDAILAEALFREGRALMRAGDVAQACPKLAESYRQDAATGTLLALAMCHEKAGQLASAWTTYNAVVARAEREGQADREKAARRRAAALEPRLSQLGLEIPPELARLPGFTVSRDGQPVPPAAWGSPMPIDPGEHTIEASAEGRISFKQTVVIGAEADHQTLRVELGSESSEAPLAPVPSGVAAKPTPAKPTPAKPTPAKPTPTKPTHPEARASHVTTTPVSGEHSEKTRGSVVRTVGVAVGLTGLATLAGGAFFGVRTLVLDAESREDGHCDAKSGCDLEGASLNDQAKDSAKLANILYATGGVLAAAGVTLYFVGAPRRSDAVSLQISPATAGLSLKLGVRAGF